MKARRITTSRSGRLNSPRRVGHIPKVLYHWRVLPGSTALSGSAKPESFNAGMRAVQDALDRRGVQAKAYQPDWAAKANCGIFSHKFPDDGPRVAIIIPTKNNRGGTTAPASNRLKRQVIKTTKS